MEDLLVCGEQLGYMNEPTFCVYRLCMKVEMHMYHVTLLVVRGQIPGIVSIHLSSKWRGVVSWLIDWLIGDWLIACINFLCPQLIYALFLFINVLLILCKFHIIYPSSAHCPVPSYLPLTLETFPKITHAQTHRHTHTHNIENISL